MKKVLWLLRSRSLITQLLVLIVVPILLTLIFISYEGISQHEHAMQSLVGDRDERAVRAATEVLTDRFVQRRLTLNQPVDVERMREGLARIDTTATRMTDQVNELLERGTVVKMSRGS